MRAIAVLLFACCFIGITGCDKLKQAGDLAEFTAYYTTLGMEMDQVEQQWNTVLPQLTDAAQNPEQRAAAITAAEAMVANLDRVVTSKAPSDPSTHRGHQAAVRMVQRRTQAIAQLEQAWEGVEDPFEASQAVVTMSNEWMAARNDFMAAAGQDSQAVFGAAAQQAQEGALANNPAAQQAMEQAKQAQKAAEQAQREAMEAQKAAAAESE